MIVISSLKLVLLALTAASHSLAAAAAPPPPLKCLSADLKESRATIGTNLEMVFNNPEGGNSRNNFWVLSKEVNKIPGDPKKKVWPYDNMKFMAERKIHYDFPDATYSVNITKINDKVDIGVDGFFTVTWYDAFMTAFRSYRIGHTDACSIEVPFAQDQDREVYVYLSRYA